MEKNERRVGTVSRGIRCPIIREGDDLAQIVTDSVLEACEAEGFSLRDRDVIAVTESIVARAQGNYVSVDTIAEDVRAKLGGETIGVVSRSFPATVSLSVCAALPRVLRRSFSCSPIPPTR